MKRSAAGVFRAVGPQPLRWSAETVIAALAPVALSERLARIENAVASRLSSVVCVIESLADPHNASAVIRTCDGLGVHEVGAIESNASVMVSDRVTKGCEKWMHLRRYETPAQCAAELRARGYALWLADGHATADLASIARIARIAVVFGNEHRGVSAELRGVCDGTFAIPMRGMVESFNVSVAAAIVLSRLTDGRAGDLGEATAREVKARFLLASVREAEMIVDRFERERQGGRV